MSARRRQQPQPEEKWDFFTFPTFVAFFGGMLVASFYLSIALDGYFDIVHLGMFVVSLFAVSWSSSRLISRAIMRRRAASRRERAEEEERERRALAARAARSAPAAGDGVEGAAPPEPPRRRRRRRR